MLRRHKGEIEMVGQRNRNIASTVPGHALAGFRGGMSTGSIPVLHRAWSLVETSPKLGLTPLPSLLNVFTQTGKRYEPNIHKRARKVDSLLYGLFGYFLYLH